MKPIIRSLALLLLAAPAVVAAQEGQGLAYHFSPVFDNTSSLQRGARNFMNYCSGCHTLTYMRYSRVANDLSIPDQLMKRDLDFTGVKLLQPMDNAMPKARAAAWFGKAPPDLSLVVRYRGPSWVYSYLMTYYVDPGTNTGVNNTTFPGTAMPFPLWTLQGWQTPVYGQRADGEKYVKSLTVVQQGSMSPQEYRRFVGDLVNFLTYVSEPNHNQRVSLGVKVVIYLIVLLILAYFLKREFWKDVH